jgi:hypothetical protein
MNRFGCSSTLNMQLGFDATNVFNNIFARTCSVVHGPDVFMYRVPHLEMDPGRI